MFFSIFNRILNTNIQKYYLFLSYNAQDMHLERTQIEETYSFLFHRPDCLVVEEIVIRALSEGSRAADEHS